jgi:hypothetical protein
MVSLNRKIVLRVIWYTTTGMLFFGLIVYQYITVNEKAKKNFEIFYASDLDGEITRCSISAGAVYVRLNNMPTKVAFIPETSELNDYNIFMYTAELGDRIIKPAYSDTLTLIRKNGEVYKYTFAKIP